MATVKFLISNILQNMFTRRNSYRFRPCD